MLYLLLYPLAGRFALFNVFRYPSFRIVAGFVFSLALGMAFGPPLIRVLKLQQRGQSNVREDTPDSHQQKSGTPTMGGGLILLCTLAATLLFADLANRYVWTVLLIFVGYGAVGFLDDYLKLTRKNSRGLAGRLKILLQSLLFLGALAVNFRAGDWSWPFSIDAHLTLPFVATHVFEWNMGWFYLPLAYVLVVGTSNAVNITDGLDGLAIGPSIVSASTFTILAYVAGTSVLIAKSGALIPLADYLYVPHIPESVELAVFSAALAGSGVAFLWYNSYPASVFMGDLGALAIGGALGTMAVLTKNELTSAILHGVFLAEILSVMIQVFWFKRTGRRVFLRAPWHHHLELAGYPEPKIIVRFWITSILLAGVALVSLKLR